MSDYLLCQLDKTTQLVVNAHAFVIKKLSKVKKKDGEQTIIIETWLPKYYYSEIGDAVRGYVKHALLSADGIKELDGSVPTLVKALEHMEATVKTISKEFTDMWNERMKDPVEAFLAKAGAEDA